MALRKKHHHSPKTPRARVNEAIRTREVRVIGAEGEQLGIMATSKAIALARELGLDLVEVAGKTLPPVCRILDHGKFAYAKEKKAKKTKQSQKSTGVKEVNLRPGIKEHDYLVKKDRTERFLNDGNKVKVAIRFRGREMAHTNLGRKILDRIVEDVQEVGKVDGTIAMEGRRMLMLLVPNKS